LLQSNILRNVPAAIQGNLSSLAFKLPSPSQKRGFLHETGFLRYKVSTSGRPRALLGSNDKMVCFLSESMTQKRGFLHKTLAFSGINFRKLFTPHLLQSSVRQPPRFEGREIEAQAQAQAQATQGGQVSSQICLL